jgi:phospholipid-binding lipoprotein MlaA
MKKNHSIIGVILLSLLLTGCAGTQSRNTDPENDPWEGYNRKVFAFNTGADKVFRPIAVGYDKIMPDPFQRGVGNFFRNLDAPVTYVNQVLQGKFKDSISTIGRFLVNSTVGILGFFDVATKWGMPFYNEDLGQTLATWGYDNSRYLMIPFFGPSTFRDGTGRLVDSFYHPVGAAIHGRNKWGIALHKVLLGQSVATWGLVNSWFFFFPFFWPLDIPRWHGPPGRQFLSSGWPRLPR